MVKSPTHSVGQWVKVHHAEIHVGTLPRNFPAWKAITSARQPAPHGAGPGNGNGPPRPRLTAPALKDGNGISTLATKDVVGNVSKEAAHYPVWIDTAAPKSQMKPLAPVLDRTQVSSNGEAADAGSEWHRPFDVQVKAGQNGAWADWLTKIRTSPVL